MRKALPCLPFSDTRHLQAHQFLVDEAYLLDAQQYELWLDTLTDDIRYVMPVRVTTALGSGFDTAPGMAHFDEDKYSLSRRVARFQTELANMGYKFQFITLAGFHALNLSMEPIARPV